MDDSSEICVACFPSFLSQAMKGIHEFDLSKYPNVVAWHAKCKAEMKGFEDTGAAGWWEFISSKAEGKNIE